MSKDAERAPITREVILEAVAAHVAGPLPADALEHTLAELGYDSLAAVELQLDLEVLVGRPLGIDRVARRGGLALKLGDLVQAVLAEHA